MKALWQSMYGTRASGTQQFGTGVPPPSLLGLSHERESEVTIMFTDAENRILFLSLKSLDWLPTRPIDTKIIIDQIVAIQS